MLNCVCFLCLVETLVHFQIKSQHEGYRNLWLFRNQFALFSFFFLNSVFPCTYPKEVWELCNSPLEGTFSLPREREMAVCTYKRRKYEQHVEHSGFLGLYQTILPGFGPVCTHTLTVIRLLCINEGIRCLCLKDKYTFVLVKGTETWMFWRSRSWGMTKVSP